MLSKNQIKLINQLHQKKYRKKRQLFVAEGLKTVKELLSSTVELHKLFTTTDIFYTEAEKHQLITETELKKISRLQSPQIVLGIFKIPKAVIDPQIKLTLALESVRDPGNLGTIIRLCDWFGVGQLVCSTDTVDCHNPKTVQATMGSLPRINIVYSDLAQFLRETNRPIYGTFMDGNPIYDQPLSDEGILVMGNEANGISQKVGRLVSYRLGIPQFGQNKKTESLNVATATAITLSEFRRR